MSLHHLLTQNIQAIVNEFLQEPYRFFTEAEAVTRFHKLLNRNASLSKKYQSKDSYQIGVIHQEFPTMFRFKAKDPSVKTTVGSRGHYDIVILNPAFIEQHLACVVTNREIGLSNTRNKTLTPLQAIIEFKLGDRAWSMGKTRGIKEVLGKLVLSQDDAELFYVVVLQRQSNRFSSNGYFPAIEEASRKQYSNIHTVFATSWLGDHANQSPTQWLGAWSSSHNTLS